MEQKAEISALEHFKALPVQDGSESCVPVVGNDSCSLCAILCGADSYLILDSPGSDSMSGPGLFCYLPSLTLLTTFSSVGITCAASSFLNWALTTVICVGPWKNV